MTDRPILFSAPMVRALADGTKTQTRRLLKDDIGELDKPFMMDDGSWHVTASDGTHMSPLSVRYRAEDRLWVREAFRIYGAGSAVPAEACRGKRPVQYRADGYEPQRYDERSPIHMPRWASRLTLTVTGVRVQRLQEITRDDAIAEGAMEFPCKGLPRGPDATYLSMVQPDSKLLVKAIDPVSTFALFFQELHGAEIWRANPWVVATSFTVYKRNIDSVERVIEGLS